MVKYSEEVVPASASVEADLYATLLESESGRRIRFDTLHFAIWQARDLKRRIPGHWADTLKEQVAAALDDRILRQTADTVAVFGVLRRLGADLAPPAGTTAPIFWVSRPSYNADSTIAAVYKAYHSCPYCAGADVFLLARRPGYRWRIWQWFNTFQS